MNTLQQFFYVIFSLLLSNLSFASGGGIIGTGGSFVTLPNGNIVLEDFIKQFEEDDFPGNRESFNIKDDYPQIYSEVLSLEKILSNRSARKIQFLNKEDPNLGFNFYQTDHVNCQNEKEPLPNSGTKELVGCSYIYKKFDSKTFQTHYFNVIELKTDLLDSPHITLRQKALLIMHEIFHHLFAKSKLISDIPDPHMLIFPLISNLNTVYNVALKQRQLYNETQELYQLSSDELKASQTFQRALARLVNSILKSKYKEKAVFERKKITAEVYPFGGGVLDIYINPHKKFNFNDSIAAGDIQSYIAIDSALTNGIVVSKLLNDSYVPTYTNDIGQGRDQDLYQYAAVINLTMINSYIELSGDKNKDCSYNPLNFYCFNFIYNTSVINSEIVYDNQLHKKHIGYYLNSYMYLASSQIRSSLIKNSSLINWSVNNSKVLNSYLTGSGKNQLAESDINNSSIQTKDAVLNQIQIQKSWIARGNEDFYYDQLSRILGTNITLENTLLERVNISGNDARIQDSSFYDLSLKMQENSSLYNVNFKLTRDGFSNKKETCGFFAFSSCNEQPKVFLQKEINISDINITMDANAYYSHDNALVFNTSLSFNPLQNYYINNMTAPGWLSGTKVWTPDLSSIESFEQDFFSFGNSMEEYREK